MNAPIAYLPALILLATGASATMAQWSQPVRGLVGAHGKVAVANRVHMAGHLHGNLIHRSSADHGATWSEPVVIAPAGSNFPMQYGGLFAAGDTVYLLTAAGHMGPTNRHLDFRRSDDNGLTWTQPVRLTAPGQELRRARIVASGPVVHVVGASVTADQKIGGTFYFRSTDHGATWELGRKLVEDAGQTIAVDGSVVHVAYTRVRDGVGGGDTHYIRSADDGVTWSQPVYIGERGESSDRQARVQVVAAHGRVLVVWQREGRFTGAPLPEDRLGYNRSEDGGATWLGPQVLPGGRGVDRNHQQVSMTASGAVHVAWCHGPSGQADTSAGYMHSRDFGATWADVETAVSTPDRANLPHGIVADDRWVHLIAEPNAAVYVRRPVEASPRHER